MAEKIIPSEAREIELSAERKCSLCTCGASKVLPFCDNSHRELNEKEGTNYKSLKLWVESDTKAKVFCKKWEE